MRHVNFVNTNLVAAQNSKLKTKTRRNIGFAQKRSRVLN